MLELLAERDIRCTCFVLGWVADRCPELIRRLAAAGHEIASHGYGHELVYRLTPSEFREDVRRCKVVLEDLVSAPVVGYRAPSFSITDWSIPILQELGFQYDSSLFPALAHDRYGRIDGRRPARAHRRAGARLQRGLHLVPVRRIPRAPVGRRRLLPVPALSRLPAWRGRHPRLGGAVCLLHPPLGDRPRPAARQRASANARLPALRRAAHGRAPVPVAARRLRLDHRRRRPRPARRTLRPITRDLDVGVVGVDRLLPRLAGDGAVEEVHVVVETDAR